MKQVLTAKLKLLTTPEQFKALRQTQLAYRDALNHVSRYAFAHGKMSNKVKLQDGTTVTADDAYLRSAILNPRAIAGYSAIMPTFQGQVNEEEVLQLIAYLKSLGSPAERKP